jgi:uncharacterized protein with HEPN domain
MSGRRDESVVLDDIVTAAQRVVDLVGALPSGQLGSDTHVGHAVLWNLTVLGEATKRLRPETRERFADVPWTDFTRTRDYLVHHYEGVDWRLLEEVGRKELPRMLPKLNEIRDLLQSEADSSA